MSHSIAGSTRPVAFADALRQIRGSRCARRLRVLLDYPPQPITERDQITPLGQPKRYIASLLVDSGEGVRLVWSLNNLDVAHNRQRTHKQTDGSPLGLNRPKRARMGRQWPLLGLWRAEAGSTAGVTRYWPASVRRETASRR